MSSMLSLSLTTHSSCKNGRSALETDSYIIIYSIGKPRISEMESTRKVTLIRRVGVALGSLCCDLPVFSQRVGERFIASCMLYFFFHLSTSTVSHPLGGEKMVKGGCWGVNERTEQAST